MHEARQRVDIELDRECAAFAQYLTGRRPGDYILEKYRDAHGRDSRLLDGRDAADRFLLALARRSMPAAWLVDCYTALVFKTATVRRKWVLVVALLESSTPSAELFDAPDRGGTGRLVARLGVRGLLFGVGVLGSLVLLAPVHAMLLTRSRWSE